MPGLLSELLAAGTIQRLDGDDERFSKMERAASTVAETLRQQPAMLIRAVLAGLDPEIPPADPAIVLAERSLTAEWKSMASIFPDKPIGWLRFILLAACSEVAGDRSAAILWLTAADTLPWMRLGREEPAVRGALARFAEEAERAALDAAQSAPTRPPKDVELATPEAPVRPHLKAVNRQALLPRVAAAAGPNYRGQQGPNPNGYWSNSAQHWSWEFSDRMTELLGAEFDSLAKNLIAAQFGAVEQLHGDQKTLVATVQAALTNQRRWVSDALRSAATKSRVEQLRVDALWWSQALYSNSSRRSYREMPAQLASVVMALDLLDAVSLPTPASVAYLLGETVSRLPNVAHGERQSLGDVLSAVHDQRSLLTAEWRKALIEPPADGRLSIRDLALHALGDHGWSRKESLRRAGLTGDEAISLPEFARAVFRQEQAVRLAEQSK